MSRTSAASLIVFVLALAGCADPPKPPPPPPADTAPAEAEAPPPAPLAVSKIGQLALLNPGLEEGECISRAEATRLAAFRGTFPPRTLSVETGAGTRDFVPAILRAEIKQLPGTEQEETESIYVLFSASGTIERGRRDYASVKDPSTNEQRGLLPEDSNAVRQLALAVLNKCP